MGIFFGTDGIRGVVNDFLTYDLAYKCGNAVGASFIKPTILIGGDTRTTRSFLTSAFSGGAMDARANIIDIGVCPTAGVAYLTKLFNYNFGVVISASHNPKQFNGIKVFGKDGFKLGDNKEEFLERKFINQIKASEDDIGCYSQNYKLTNIYEDFLVNSCETRLDGLTIVLDCSNGASYKIAPRVFRRLGAKVISTYSRNDGRHINDNCGSLHPEVLAKNVKKYKADMGFAFDGDADRIIASDENGEVVDGDIIIYMLTKYLKSLGKLKKNTIVGTSHTNMGIEKALNKDEVKLIRTDIGDKYVIAKIEEQGLSLGGEKSGHIILRDYTTTGDGILTGVKLAEMVVALKKSLGELKKVDIYPQCNIDCIVTDKIKIINSEELSREVERQEKYLGDNSRIMVRVSGTEPKIRIMVESIDAEKANLSASIIAKIVHSVDSEG